MPAGLSFINHAGDRRRGATDESANWRDDDIEIVLYEAERPREALLIAALPKGIRPAKV